ncbi:hypothetical protein Y032_0009g428 [Ancylostoma ceylanicum]|uniref:Uncharacterized protein n=1 Tax=Ancylostoma ceylanicum TaxID=53326 RepID=A0A016VH13_9BILA|nr:hypothetical protein Y032_0009g428 [Ancylostoma ceylanicum]
MLDFRNGVDFGPAIRGTCTDGACPELEADRRTCTCCSVVHECVEILQLQSEGIQCNCMEKSYRYLALLL